MTRVLVCGGRNYEDRRAVGRALAAIHAETPISVVIEGDASGADRIASNWARHNRICNLKVPAHWATLGKAAGAIRNGWMIDFCRPELVVAFPGGPGTRNMVEQATAAGIPVRDLRQDA